MSRLGGLPVNEFRARLARAQNKMAAMNLDALFLTSEPEFRYFSGFLTRFWESPSRPWFLIVPVAGDPVAVIPSIGEPLMQQTWVTDIRTWVSPDRDDEGLSLLAGTLAEIAPNGGRIGVPSGPEAVLRMSLNDYARLQDRAATLSFVHDGRLVAQLRSLKSEHEIDLIRSACRVADQAFASVPDLAEIGKPLSQVFREFQMLCLSNGADWVPYLAGGAGPDGYRDVISPATETALDAGDVLMLDTGLMRDGYFCDFDRNYAVGFATDLSRSAHARLIDATSAGYDAAKPGATAADVHKAMVQVLGDDAGAGRLGHGLGMQLTEGLSLIPTDYTVLEPGMVLTLEPGLTTRDGRIMVHEENVVLRETGAEALSSFVPHEIPVIA